MFVIPLERLVGGRSDDYQAFGWRSALYFLAAFAGLVEILFIFFPDTWRREVCLRGRIRQSFPECQML